MIIEQFLPALHYGDAVGNSTLSFHRYLLARGIESRIIAITIDPRLKEFAIPFENYSENPTARSIKVLHFAVPSPLTDFFLRIEGKKVMIYHNITPSHFFVDFSDQLTRMTHEGREHLKQLKGCFDLCIADSGYNAEELIRFGYNNVHVFPLLVDLSDYETPYSVPYYNLLKDDRKTIIFVGRVSPNKKIEDLIKVLYFYQKYISPSIRLIIAGNTNALPKYFQSLRELVQRLFHSPDVVFFTQHIPFEELLAVYRLADVFLSMSEHEGFCLPLIESCYLRVPVVAYGAGAVPETLDNSGIVFNEKDFPRIAGLLEQVIHDEKLREKLQSLQVERIRNYKTSTDPHQLFGMINEL